MILALVYFLLFLLPFLVLPIYPLAFEPPKVVIAQAVIEIIIVVFIFSKSYKNHTKIELNLALPSLILVSLVLIGALVNPNPKMLFGNIFRLQGGLLLLHLITFSFIISRLNLAKLNPLYFLLPLLGLLASGLILGENRAGRAVGTLGEPNALAATAIFMLTFVLTTKKRFLTLSAIAAASIIVFLSKSGSSLIALFIVLFGMFLLNILKLKLALVSLILCVVVIISLFLPFLIGGSWYENRSEIWATAWSSGLSSPIWGHGFGNVQEALEFSSEKLNNNIQYQVVDSSHNFLLDFFVQGGILALLSILTLIVGSLSGLIKQNRPSEILSLFAIITCLLFNPLSVINLLAFWFLIGYSFQKA